MPPDFDDQLKEIIARSQAERAPFEVLQKRVHELFAKHRREVPPPVTGTFDIEEPPDTFGN